MTRLEVLDVISYRRSPEVFHAKSWGISWGTEVIESLKLVAAQNPRQRSRLCLNPTPQDRHHEMLICLGAKAIETPQRRVTGFDTKVVIDGEASIQYFTLDGRLSSAIDLGESGQRYVNTRGENYHALRSKTEWFVFLEICEGPFYPGVTQFAPWALPEVSGGKS